MRVLLDNCVAYRAKGLFPGHEVVHAKDLDWDALANGKLLAAAGGAGFEVMITVDKHIRGQQNLNELPLTVLEINSPDSRLPELARLAQFVLQALVECQHYRFVSVQRDGRIETLVPRV